MALQLVKNETAGVAGKEAANSSAWQKQCGPRKKGGFCRDEVKSAALKTQLDALLASIDIAMNRLNNQQARAEIAQPHDVARMQTRYEGLQQRAQTMLHALTNEDAMNHCAQALVTDEQALQADFVRNHHDEQQGSHHAQARKDEHDDRLRRIMDELREQPMMKRLDAQIHIIHHVQAKNNELRDDLRGLQEGVADFTSATAVADALLKGEQGKAGEILDKAVQAMETESAREEKRMAAGLAADKLAELHERVRASVQARAQRVSDAAVAMQEAMRGQVEAGRSRMKEVYDEFVGARLEQLKAKLPGYAEAVRGAMGTRGEDVVKNVEKQVATVTEELKKAGRTIELDGADCGLVSQAFRNEDGSCKTCGLVLKELDIQNIELCARLRHADAAKEDLTDAMLGKAAPRGKAAEELGSSDEKIAAAAAEFHKKNDITPSDGFIAGLARHANALWKKLTGREEGSIKGR